MSETRKLTEKEQKRLDRFEQTAKELQEKGYRRVDLVVDIAKANAFRSKKDIIRFTLNPKP